MVDRTKPMNRSGVRLIAPYQPLALPDQVADGTGEAARALLADFGQRLL
jgi:hypothetical protein